MSNCVQKHISAKDGTDFYKQVAAFSFEGFLQHGVGAVIVQEGEFEKHPDGKVEAHLLYVPYEMDSNILPPETVEMINKYEPESEVVLAIVGKDGMATCLTLTAQKIGCSPVTAHMKGKEWHVDIDPGTVLRLKEPIGEIQPGFYVFLREEKAMMKLARAGMDDDEGEIVATEEQVDVHVDFRDLFERTGINVYND